MADAILDRRQWCAVMTHRNLHRLNGSCISVSRGFHTEGLVRPSMVVKLNPVPNDPTGVL